MIYNISLSWAAILLGALIVITRGMALWKFEMCRERIQTLHRNFKAGLVIFALTTAWVVWLLATIDLMEYSHLRGVFIGIALVLAGLVVKFLPDYLAIRGMGLLFLLFAKVLLDSAFLSDDPVKFAIVAIAYLIAIAGMVWVAAPYMFRDMVAWLYANDRRAKTAHAIGLGLGILLIALGIWRFA